MGKTSIEWTDVTWNPTRGCSRVSEGCRNCYAERVAGRFGTHWRDGSEHEGAFAGFAIMTPSGPHWTGKVELIEEKLREPLYWRAARRVFVNSMSDLFHEALPDEAIDRVVHTMAWARHHTYQILTKRHARLQKYSAMMAALSPQERAARIIASSLGHAVHIEPKDNGGLEWPLPNVWLGVSAEDQATADERIPLLLQTPAAVRFVSYEPALGPVDFLELKHGRTVISALSGWKVTRRHSGEVEDVKIPSELRGIDWLIVGGESGPHARPFDLAWVRQAIEECKAAGVPCFVKQLGARPGYQRKDGWHDITLRDPKGGDMSEWPEDLRVREFPEPA